MAQPVGGLRVATRPPSEPEELDVEELVDDDVVAGVEVRDSVGGDSLRVDAGRSTPSDRSRTGGFRVAVRPLSPDDDLPLLSPRVSPPREVVAPVPLELEPLGLYPSFVIRPCSRGEPTGTMITACESYG